MSNIQCYWCGSNNHLCRDCPIEKAESRKLRGLVGEYFEEWISENYSCPKCKKESLVKLGNNSPSCDLICTCCRSIYEVKSKCLSSKKLPSDININHGNYQEFKKRIENENLSLFLVIYGVDRRKKEIYVRKVLLITNEELKNQELIEFEERKERKSSLTQISIPNYHKLDNLILPNHVYIPQYEIF